MMSRSLLFVTMMVAAAAVIGTTAAMPTEHRLRRTIFPPAVVTYDAPEATGKGFVHQTGINLIQNIVNAILQDSLTNLPLPDQTIPIAVGHVDLSNIVVKSVTFTAQEVGLVAPNQMTIDMNNVQGEVDFDWEYHGLLGIHFSGSAVNTFDSTSIDTTFTLDATSAGVPHITLPSLDVSIGDLDIHLSGGGSWLWNFLIGLFKPLIVDIIQNKIDDIASTDINNILSSIEAKWPLAIPMTGALLNNTQLNFGLVPGSAPGVSSPLDGPVPFSIAGEYLVGAGEWSFSSTTNTTIDPRPHDYIPDAMPTNPAGTAPMFGFAGDEYFMGSLLYSLTQNRKFDFYVDNSMIPASSPIHLTTFLISNEYPALYAAYPNNNISVTITQYGEQPPLATTSPDGTSWSNAVSFVLNVIDPTQPDPIVPVCELYVNYSLVTNFELLDNETSTVFLTGKIQPLVFGAEIVWATYDAGTFANDVQSFVQLLADSIIVPLLDSYLATGIAIPTNFGGVSLENIFISYGNHEMSLGFDVVLGGDETRQELAAALKEWSQQ